MCTVSPQANDNASDTPERVVEPRIAGHKSPLAQYVAQTSSLLYRRFPNLQNVVSEPVSNDVAGYKSSFALADSLHAQIDAHRPAEQVDHGRPATSKLSHVITHTVLSCVMLK